MDPNELDSVYVTRGSKISKEAIVELIKAAPHFNNRIQERGDALLGVVCDESLGACHVSRVAPNTAAARCGLQEGDLIVKYNGEMLTSFQRLTEITSEHEVGDKVVLEVRREGEILELEATLGEWE
jgi:S1-C subfamily serine protease